MGLFAASTWPQVFLSSTPRAHPQYLEAIAEPFVAMTLRGIATGT